MPNFPSTLLPQTNEPEQIQKAILDLLDKINQIASSVKAGTIEMWPSSKLKEGYLWCDGDAYARAEYQKLFAEIGTLWGAPDSATFRVPDFRGVSPTGVGAQDINGRTKTGPALGAVREDQGQGHHHLEHVGPDATNANTNLVGSQWRASSDSGGAGLIRNATTQTNPNTIGNPDSDGVNGTPRTGAYTHGPEIGVNFIIKT